MIPRGQRGQLAKEVVVAVAGSGGKEGGRLAWAWQRTAAADADGRRQGGGEQQHKYSRTTSNARMSASKPPKYGLGQSRGIKK